MAGEPGGLTAADRRHLDRCCALAEQALAAGDGPYGSVLVAGDGTVLREDRNRNASVAPTWHPELELARWAGAHLDAAARAAATVYTSTEHCPMCSAAHAWTGLGRIVFATAAADVGVWRRDAGGDPQPIAMLGIDTIAPDQPRAGPFADYAPRLRPLHEADARRNAR